MNIKNALEYALAHCKSIHEESNQYLIGISLNTKHDFSILSIRYENDNFESGWVGRVISADINSRYTYEDYIFEVSSTNFISTVSRYFGLVEFNNYTLDDKTSLDLTIEEILFQVFKTKLPNHHDVETANFKELATKLTNDINSKSSSSKLKILQ